MGRDVASDGSPRRFATARLLESGEVSSRLRAAVEEVAEKLFRQVDTTQPLERSFLVHDHFARSCAPFDSNHKAGLFRDSRKPVPFPKIFTEYLLTASRRPLALPRALLLLERCIYGPIGADFVIGPVRPSGY